MVIPVITQEYNDPRDLSWSSSWIITVLLNICLLVLLVTWSSYIASNSGTNTIILGLGVVGIWRHSWGLINFFRATYFIRSSRDAAKPIAVGHYSLSIIFPVYDQTEGQLRAVAAGIVNSVLMVSGRVLIVCAYRDEAQKKMLSELIENETTVMMHFVRQRGMGKREALADTLNIVKASIPNGPKEFVLLMDGDTILTPEAILRSIGEMQKNAQTGAICVNEVPLVKGTKLFVAWRWLRSIQRNQIMSSFALSRRVLVLTGRFAMYRSDILLRPEFINRIRKDYIIHKDTYISLLTGDDKTTWLEVLRRGFDVCYLPDVFIYPIEEQKEEDSFVKETIALTTRYSGNMARANLHPDAWRGAAGKLHFKYGLLDQRVSMWTSLLTPVVLVVLILFDDFDIFILFLTYTLIIKNIQAIAWSKSDYNPVFPYLIFYNQVMGSLVKIFTFAFLHRQKWNNQKISVADNPGMLALDKNARLSILTRSGLFVTFITLVYFVLR